VFILPNHVLPVEYGKNYSLNAPVVGETAHRSCAPSYLSKDSLNNVRRPELFPHRSRTLIKPLQIFQIAFQALNGFRGDSPPGLCPGLKNAFLA